MLRQLWLQAAELTEDALADAIRAQLRSQPGPGLAPRWTTRRASRALSGELGRHDDRVWAVAALADGRVVSGGRDRRVLVWDPASPASGPLELGCSVTALAMGSLRPGVSFLVVAHAGAGFSLWSLIGCHEE